MHGALGSRRILVFLIFLIACSVHGQIPSRGQNVNLWLQNKEMILLHADAHAKGGPAIWFKGKQERVLPSLPKGVDHPQALRRREAPLQGPGGDCFSLQYLSFPAVDGKGKSALRLDVFRFSTATWTWEKEPHGVLEDRPLGNFRVLSEDYLLGICVNQPFLDSGKKPHIFSLYKRNSQGKYRLVGYPDDGLAGKVFKGDGSWNYPIFSNLWILNRCVWTEDEMVVGTGFGFFWVFSPKGQMRKLVRLYDSVDDKLLRNGWVWHEAVTNFQPRPDGRILISALAEGAVARGAILNDQRSHQSDSPQEFEKVFSTVIAAYPVVEWHVMDPSTGQIQPEAAPVNFPSRLSNHSDFMNFNWQFKVDGNLLRISERDLLAVSEEGERYYEKTFGPQAK